MVVAYEHSPCIVVDDCQPKPTLHGIYIDDDIYLDVTDR